MSTGPFVVLARRRGFAGYLRTRAVATVATIACATGDLEAAIRWADDHEVPADEALSFTRGAEHVSWVRVRIAEAVTSSPSYGSRAVADHALVLLDRLLERATVQARTDSVISILVLRALALDVRRDRDAAVATLARTLVLAEPAGYVPVFADAGPAMAGLLRAARGRGRTSGYVDTLLAATQGSAESSRAHSAVSRARSGTT